MKEGVCPNSGKKVKSKGQGKGKGKGAGQGPVDKPKA